MQKRGTLHAWLFVALTGLAATSARADAQTVQGSVQGRVTDPAGGAIGGAAVQITGEATGITVSVRSDDRGWFAVGPIGAGAYRLDVSRDGFKRHSQAVRLAVNQALRLDVRLEPGALSEVVTVTAPSGGLERLSASLVTRLSPEQLAQLPLDGRNFLDLALLASGSAPAAFGSAGSVRGDFTFNVNGAREDSNTYLLDGAYNFDPKLNTVGVRPALDAIQEFEVITALPDASFGKGSGAQINVVTRSGTNTLRVTAHEFVRTGLFGARNHFAPASEPAPDYRRHQYGASIGGALRADQLFFFGDFEGTRLTEGLTRLTTVPTLAERVGNFAGSALRAPRNPFTGQPFAGGQIPGPFLNPIGLAIAALYPRPNRDNASANFVSSPELTDAVDQFDGRLDYVTGGTRVTARYSFADRRLFEPFAGPTFAAVPGFGTDVPRRAQNLLVSAIRPMGSRVVNDARVSWSRVAASAFHENQGATRSLNRQVGLPDPSANARDWGLSFITVAGFSALGDEFNNPQDSRTDLWQVNDTLSWIAGAHTLKAGVEIRGIAQDAYRDVQSRGLLQFTDQAFTGNGLADLLLGLPTVSVVAKVDNPQRLRTSSYAAFLQDTWQWSPTLTLSGGVRYEFHAPPVDADDRVTIYDPSTGTVVPVATSGLPRSGVEADRNNFAPRVGAAWSVLPDTVVRVGYGVSYDQASLAPNEFLYFNAPYFTLSTYFTVPAAGYTLTLFDPFPASFPVPLPPSATAVDRNLRTGYLHTWHAGVQHQMRPGRTLEVAYVGTRGRSLLVARDLNQPAPSPRFPNLRPNPRFADITLIESRARSEYDALQVRYDRRLDRGLMYTASYTLGRSNDDASGFFASGGDANFPMDSNNPAGEWARSNFDVRHRLTLTGMWEVPFGPNRRWLQTGAAGSYLGGWDLFAILTVNSGRPFTVRVHPDQDVSNTGRANLGFGANDRPNQVGDPGNGGSESRWFDPAAFALPPFGTFGDVGRNSLDGPGFKSLNLALVRRVALPRGGLQVRLEFFNALNWTNFDLPDAVLGSPTFGQILSAGAPRRFQLGLRYEF